MWLSATDRRQLGVEGRCYLPHTSKKPARAPFIEDTAHSNQER